MRTTILVTALLAALVGCSSDTHRPTPAASVTSSLLPQSPAPVALYVGTVKLHADKLRTLATHLEGCVAPEGFGCSANLDAATTEVTALGNDIDDAQHVGRVPDEAKSAFDALVLALLPAETALRNRSVDFPAAVLAVQDVAHALEDWRPFGV